MSDAASFSHSMIHVGDDWRLRCSTYADTTPILAIDAGQIALCITAKDRKATSTTVEFARTLATEAQRFADEMERMLAAQLDADGKAAEVDAA